MINDKEMVIAIRELGLQKNQFAVCGSGVMLIHGLIPFVPDIDIIAYGEAWDDICKSKASRKAPLGDNMVSFRDGLIEVFDGWASSGWRVKDIVAEADVVDGIRYVRLER